MGVERKIGIFFLRNSMVPLESNLVVSLRNPKHFKQVLYKNVDNFKFFFRNLEQLDNFNEKILNFNYLAKAVM